MKRFCQKCGSGTDYTVTKPSFCGRCGVSYEAVAAAPKPVPAPVQQRPVARPTPVRTPEPEYYDEETEARETNFDPNDLTGLDFQILMPPQSKTVIGQLVGTPGNDEPIRTIPKKVNRKQILDDLLPNRGKITKATKRKA